MSLGALRARPLYRSTHASVSTSGEAFEVRATSTRPVKAHQIIIEPSARIFVGLGTSATPPSPTVNNTVYQPAQERVYTFDGNDALEKYLYIYAISSTVEVFISFFG